MKKIVLFLGLCVLGLTVYGDFDFVEEDTTESTTPTVRRASTTRTPAR